MPENSFIRLVPLSYRQLLDYLKAENMLEKELCLAVTGRTVSADIRARVQKTTLPAMHSAGEVDYLYHTFWLVIEKSSNSIVAELGFKGLPDENGEVEIGYGAVPGQQNKGFMTAGVHVVMQWALQQETIRAVLAEIDETNIASIRVVEKNGFTSYDKKGNMLWWKKITR